MNGSNIFIGPRLTAVRFDGSSEKTRGERTINGVFSNQGERGARIRGEGPM